MARKEWRSMSRQNPGKPTLVAYLCHFRPEPDGGFTVTCPKLPPVVTYGETLEEAQANSESQDRVSSGDQHDPREITAIASRIAGDQ
jgi:hypothetical protein